MKKSKHQSKKRQLFDPDEVSTCISQAIVRDLEGPTHVYGDSNDPLAYAKSRQRSEILSKYCSPSQDREALDAATFQKFLEMNSHMGNVNKALEVEIPWKTTRIQSSMPEMEKIHLRARALMHEVLTPMDEDEWFEECRNSTGSTVGVSFNDTSPEAKFTFPLSSTEGCLLYWSRYRMFNTQLNMAIQEWNAENPVKDPISICKGSRATTVDKTTTKRRFICVEPTLNMFFQQGLMHALYKRMRKCGLDVELLPDINKRLAQISSITGRNATIDWSSASDCVSIKLLEWLLPQTWFVRVYNTRSHSILLKDEWVNPEMISTMGNAVTFPLETLVFWTYAHAVHHTLTEPGSNSLFKIFEERPGLDSISVFGDDCVVPSFMAESYIRSMTQVGFLINSEKSCIDKLQFRESCGGDYLAGFDVRPYFLKAPPSNRVSALEPWLYTIWNRCIKKYISCFGTLSYVYDRELWRTLALLFAKYKLQVKLVPSFMPEDSGLHAGFDLLRFVRHYGFELSPIARSHQGTITFRYCRFVYWETPKRSDDIRLALWLQKPRVNLRKVIGPTDDTFSTRKKGGYVVAKGVTSHWDVPSVKREAC